MSDNFDLKKYLVENKATTNSRMLNEALDFKVKLLVPTVYYDVASGELADSPNEWYTEDELEDADVTSYTDGTELATVVFDSDMARAKQMEKQYPGLFKVMPTGGMAEMKKKHSKMMKENAGTEVIEVQGGSRGEIENVKLITTDKSFEQFCIERGEEILQDLLSGRLSNDDPGDAEAAEYRADYAEEFSVGEPVFNASKSLCDIAEGEESGYVYIDASKIDSETKKMLLDDNTDPSEIYNILDDLY